jgi:hypothetical protein
MKKDFRKLPQNRVYTEEDRMQVALMYLIMPSAAKIARQVKMPARTVRQWIAADWFRSYLRAARTRYQKVLDSRMTKIIHKAMDKLSVVVNKGEEVVTKNGTVRKELSGRDLVYLLDNLSKQREQIRMSPEEEAEEQSTQEHLKQLLDDFNKSGLDGHKKPKQATEH